MPFAQGKRNMCTSCNSNRWKLNNSNQAAAYLQRGIRATGGWTLFIFAGLALSKAAESPGLCIPVSLSWGLWAHLSPQAWRKQIPVCACMGQCVPVLWGHTHRAGERRQIEWEQFSKCSLLAQTPPDADNRLVYCTPLAPHLTWPNIAIYARFPCLILLMFILIHNAEAGLRNSETKVLAANMSQYGQVVFSHMNYIVILHKWGHGKK